MEHSLSFLETVVRQSKVSGFDQEVLLTAFRSHTGSKMVNTTRVPIMEVLEEGCIRSLLKKERGFPVFLAKVAKN